MVRMTAMVRMTLVSKSLVKARMEEEDQGTHRLMVEFMAMVSKSLVKAMEEEDQETHRLMVD